MKYNQIINNLNLLIDSGIREFLEDSPQKYYNAKNEKNLYKDNLNKIKDLSELEIAIKNFNGCNLKNSAKNTVFADGNPNAKVMFIGEAPGKDEDIKGIPFVGLAGQLLDKMLFSIKLDRSEVYITNIIPWRPPGNRQPTTQEMLLCVPFIQKHIELVRPKILVLLGGTATKALLLLDEGIMKSRGKWHKYSSYGLANPILTRAIFHPAFLLRSPSYKKLAWEDLKEIEKKLNDN
ncbi:MAG: uracil-DNA glycosylase [Pelagibacteraceae bacterium]|nr:uracil-DNA glycosylase [Pelagibacteraceae bacterium]